MRFRFSLRLFFILFTLLAIALGAGANFYYGVMQETLQHEAARQRLAELGVAVVNAPLSYAPEDASWRKSFARNWIDSRAFPVAGSLDVIQSKFSPTCEEVLEAARGLRGVYHLNLKTDELTLPIVNLLLRRDDLDSLHLSCDTIGAGAANRLPLLSSLHQLNIQESVSKDQFEAIARAPRLEYLNLNVTGLTPEEKPARRRFPALIQATLTGAVEGPEITRALVASQSLFRLTLGKCTVSPGSLAPLEGSQSLRMVNVEEGCEAPADLLAAIVKAPMLENFTMARAPSAAAVDLTPLTKSTSIQEIELIGIDLTGAELRDLLSISQLQSLAFADMGVSETMQFLLDEAKLRQLPTVEQYPPIFEWNSSKFEYWGRTLTRVTPGELSGS